MILLVDDWIDIDKLSDEWLAITGDSDVVDVRRVKPTKINNDEISVKSEQKKIIAMALWKYLNTP